MVAPAPAIEPMIDAVATPVQAPFDAIALMV